MGNISDRSSAARRFLTSLVLEGFHLLLGIRSELLVPAWSMFLHAALGLALQVLLFLGLYFLHSREGGEAVSDGSFEDHTVQQARRRWHSCQYRPTRLSWLTLGSPECCGHIKCPGHDGMNDMADQLMSDFYARHNARHEFHESSAHHVGQCLLAGQFCGGTSSLRLSYRSWRKAILHRCNTAETESDGERIADTDAKAKTGLLIDNELRGERPATADCPPSPIGQLMWTKVWRLTLFQTLAEVQLCLTSGPSSSDRFQ